MYDDDLNSLVEASTSANYDTSMESEETQKAINEMPSRQTNIVGVLPGYPTNTLIYRRSSSIINSNNNEENTINIFNRSAEFIINEMKNDTEIMQNNPIGEQLRLKILRSMPEPLRVRCLVKEKLYKSVHTSKPLTMSLYCKYKMTSFISKMNTTLDNWSYACELWYKTLKQIEGQQGSGVATFFRFLRSILFMNIVLMIITFLFIILPQFLQLLHENYKNNTNNFEAIDILTGKGYLTNSLLYYGVYSNHSITLNNFNYYNIPHAYWFTMFFLYTICFIGLSIKMARSYRKSFIETAGGLKNVYAQKIFCGWDFTISSNEAAKLRKIIIFKELRELLNENITNIQIPFLKRCKLYLIRILINLLVIFVLMTTALIVWILLQRNKNHLLNNKMKTNNLNEHNTDVLLTSITITAIIHLIPKLFSYLTKYEGYLSPRHALYATLFRTFLLQSLIAAIFLIFWLNQTEIHCWETKLGQEMYRLIIMDFLYLITFSLFGRFGHYLIYSKIWKTVGEPKFEIAKNTINLIYTQTLFWVGFFFSPLLTFIIVVKLLIQFYIERINVINFCKPSQKSWRAAQTNTVFLVLAFLSLFCMIITFIYIFTKVPTSDCGPFQNYEYFYELILKDIFHLKQENSCFRLFTYLMKPGVIGGFLIALCVVVYYMRAKAIAQIKMVKMLREMIILESKDKEFLLKNISRVTQGGWLEKIEEERRKFENQLHLHGRVVDLSQTLSSTNDDIVRQSCRRKLSFLKN